MVEIIELGLHGPSPTLMNHLQVFMSAFKKVTNRIKYNICMHLGYMWMLTHIMYEDRIVTGKRHI